MNFKKEDIRVHDEIRSRKSSIVPDEIVPNIEEVIQADRCLTVDEF